MKLLEFEMAWFAVILFNISNIDVLHFTRKMFWSPFIPVGRCPHFQNSRAPAPFINQYKKSGGGGTETVERGGDSCAKTTGLTNTAD